MSNDEAPKTTKPFEELGQRELSELALAAAKTLTIMGYSWHPDKGQWLNDSLTKPVDPNHDIVPTLMVFDGAMMGKAAEEIIKWRNAYRSVCQMHANMLTVVGPGWHEHHVINGVVTVVDARMIVNTKATRDDPARGWTEAAVAWEVCGSIHREYASGKNAGKDPFYTVRQKDFVKHAADARSKAAP